MKKVQVNTIDVKITFYSFFLFNFEI